MNLSGAATVIIIPGKIYRAVPISITRIADAPLASPNLRLHHPAG
jgi:hypothetical protein